jgi:hypothetical protein
MRPIPEAIQKAYPCAPDRDPSRPWWKMTSFAGYIEAVRCDGALRQGRYRADPADGSLAIWPELSEAMAAYDAAHPLPHPGVRAGQVWVRSSMLGWEIFVVLGDCPVGVQIIEGASFLLADPCCPWAAPWGAP